MAQSRSIADIAHEIIYQSKKNDERIEEMLSILAAGNNKNKDELYSMIVNRKSNYDIMEEMSRILRLVECNGCDLHSLRGMIGSDE